MGGSVAGEVLLGALVLILLPVAFFFGALVRGRRKPVVPSKHVRSGRVPFRSMGDGSQGIDPPQRRKSDLHVEVEVELPVGEALGALAEEAAERLSEASDEVREIAGVSFSGSDSRFDSSCSTSSSFDASSDTSSDSGSSYSSSD
jgi:hypothetical protein